MKLNEHYEFGTGYKPKKTTGVMYPDVYSLNHWLEQWLEKNLAEPN